MNILVFVHFEFFEEFENAIVFYSINVESDIWAQNVSPPQRCHLNFGEN